MSKLTNRVQLIGHLGATPELKTLDNGTHNCRISVATNDSYKNTSGEWQEETTWHSVTLWGALAERAVLQLQTGSHIMIEGKLCHRSYVAQDGTKKYVTEIKAYSYLRLGKRSSAESAELGNQSSNTKDYAVAIEEDGLPF